MDLGNAYNGQIKDGMFHGKGTLCYSGNEKYDGNWVPTFIKKELVVL